MQISGINLRRLSFGAIAAGALGGLAATTLALPTAAAQPQCTASGLSNALGSVASATGQYLDNHPDANQVVTNAGSQSPQDGENSIRTYFAAHLQEWNDLRGIARPLASLRQQCQVQVAPAQIAQLYDAMAQ
jgi:heme-binding protein